tara:strand:+ start:3545 stop:5998 length:2454 start_codon:yes stop_codon:yes gene_type:complete
MAKKILNLNNFSGGLNNSAARRDLLPNEFAVLDGLDNEFYGKLVPLGKLTDRTVSGLPTSNTLKDGSGLLHFNSDVKIHNTSEVAGEYLAYHDVNNKGVKFIELISGSDTKQDTVHGGTVTIGDSSFAGEVDMFALDGDIRIYGTHTLSTTANTFSLPKIIQRIKYTRNLASATTLQVVEDKVKANDIHLAPVTVGSSAIYDNTMYKKGGASSPKPISDSEIFMIDDATTSLGYYNGQYSYVNFTQTLLGNYLNAHDDVSSTNFGGMLVVAYFNGSPSSVSQDDESSIVVYKSTSNKIYGLWGTLIYDDKQESGPTYLGDVKQPSLSENKVRQMHLAFAGRPSKKDRVTGFKIYWALIDSYAVMGQEVSGDVGQRYMLAEVNYEQGVRLTGETGFSKFDIKSMGSSAKNHYVFPSTGFGVTTVFEGQALSDLSIEEPLLSEKHTAIGRPNTGGKTSTVVNRKLYIGNVQYYDDNNVRKTANDRLMKSNVNDFDFFDADSFIDVEVNDGEDITVLENLSGRILQYKQNTLYIINVSRDIEFLEGTYEQRGCLKHSHLVKGEGFVSWLNKFGLFMYDGKQLINLIQSKQTGQNKVVWSDIYTDSIKLSYVPKKEQLILLKKSTNTEGKSQIILFDLKSMSFVKETTSGISGQSYEPFTTDNSTNIVQDNNGELLAITSNNYALKKWADASCDKKYSAGVVLMETKEFTFKKPNTPKNLTAVYISARNGDNIKVQVRAHTSGSNNKDLVDPNSTANNNLLPTSDEMSYKKIIVNNAKLKTTASEKVYGYSVLLTVVADGDVQSDLEVNDIQLVYREMVTT